MPKSNVFGDIKISDEYISKIKVFDGVDEISAKTTKKYEEKTARFALCRLKLKLGKNTFRDYRKTREEILTDLFSLKSSLTADQIYRLFKAELNISECITRLLVFLSFGKRQFCQVDIEIEGLTAEEFYDWYTERFWGGRENGLQLIKAHPDHYIDRISENESFEIIESTGGNPFVSQFFFFEENMDGVTIPSDPEYMGLQVGDTRLKDDTIIGAIHHQIKNTDTGCRIKLGIEFPKTAPAFFIEMHKIHLACEFTNWIQECFRYYEY